MPRFTTRLSRAWRRIVLCILPLVLTPSLAAMPEPTEHSMRTIIPREQFNQVVGDALRLLPDRGSIFAVYRSLDGGAGMIAGYDVRSHAYISVNQASFFCREPGGDVYTTRTLPNLPERIAPPSHGSTFLTDRYLPQSLMLELVSYGEACVRAERTGDGGFIFAFKFPQGLRMLYDTLKAKPDEPPHPEMDHILTVEIDPRCIVRRVHNTAGDVEFIPAYDEDSLDGFAVVREYIVQENAGWRLESFEWIPEGRPGDFRLDAAYQRAIDARTLREGIPLLPDNVVWGAPGEDDPDAPEVAAAQERVRAESRENLRRMGVRVRPDLRWWLFGGGGALVALALAYRFLLRR